MQKNSKYDNEQIYTFVVVFILILSVIFIIYYVYKSNSTLYKNSDETAQNTQNTQSNSQTSNNNTNTQEQKDKMNVDNSVIEEKNKQENTQQNIENNNANQETQIATYTTTIYDKDQNRVDNISLANEKLNGTIVKPGETFSFNDTIGPMGEKQGFKEAIGFDTDGNKIKTFGGGLCQISSTLYNCALIANLEIIERHPHSRRVYYVPKDKDATIYYGYLDFKFKNNTNNDIKILSNNDKYNVTIELYKEGA